MAANGREWTRIRWVLILWAAAACAQQVGQNTTNGPATFQTGTQLVIENVVVKDKSGKPVEGLTAKDFVVTEDGAPQTIRFFEFQKLSETPDPAPIMASGRATPFAKLTKTQISPEAPGNTRYRDRRLLALYFDMTAMPMPD